jgi:hypothetical protein
MPAPKFKYRRVLRRAGAVLGLAVAGIAMVAGLLWGYLWFNRERVQQEALALVNSQLAAPLAVRSAELDVWSRFPDVSLRLNHVFCKDVLPAGSADTLFYLPQVYVQFAAWDLVRGQTTVKRLTLRGGRVEIRQYANGTGNYQFWKESTGPNPRVDLAGVRLENVRLRLEHPAHALESRVETLTLKGSIREDRMRAQLAWKLRLPRPNPTPDRPDWAVSGFVRLVQEGERTELQNGELRWEEWVLRLTGVFAPNDWRWTAAAEDLDLAALAQNLPSAWLPDPQTVNATGKANVQIKGRTVPAGTRVQAAVQLRETAVRLPSSGWEITGAQGQLTWDNGPRGRLEDAELRVRFTSDPADGTVVLRNFTAPELEAQLKVHLPLATALAWGGFRIVESADGQVSGNVRVAKNYAGWPQLSATGLDGANVSGTLALSRGKAKLHGTGAALENLTAQLTLRSPDAHLDECRFRVGGSDFSLTGPAYRTVDWGGTDPLFLDLNLSSRNLRMEDVLAWKVWEAQEPEGASTEPATPWDYRVQLGANQITYRKVTALRARGRVWSTGDRLDADQISFSTAEGTVSGAFSWVPQGPFTELNLDAQAQRVRLSTLLREFENFGQSELTADQLDGKANLAVVCAARFNEEGSLDPASLQAVVDFTLTNGQLKGYAPLQALARYADAKALENLQFGTLSNTLTVAQQTITVPPMAVENNALSLRLNGTHAFSGAVDYTVEFRLKEALSAQKKGTKRPRELDAYLAETSDPGKVWIPVRITGTADAPKITLNTQKAAQSSAQTVRSDFKKQGAELRQLLKPSEPKPVPAQKYIFEWEEESGDTTRIP